MEYKQIKLSLSSQKRFFEMIELSPNLLMMEVRGNLGIPHLMKGKVSGLYFL